jgi:phosphoribosyl 1,2-cyclic phosphodiesterase
MVDCGFSTKETESRLSRLNKNPQDITAILVTHEHGDHINGVSRYARKYSIPVWMTHGTYACRNKETFPEVNLFHAHDNFELNDIQVEPFPVPHDAKEPCQFVFHDGRSRLAILTDTGSSTPHIEQALNGVDALMMECNHDIEMLMSGPYSIQLKQRVAGRLGHLSNTQAAEILEKIDTSSLQHLVGAHISQENNKRHLAQKILAKAVNAKAESILVADQNDGFEWLSIS